MTTMNTAPDAKNATAPTTTTKRITPAQTTAPAQRWGFLAVISLGLFLVGADNSILYTALPVLRDELHTTDLQGLWIINAYPLVLSGLLLGTGTLGDKIGHRLIFLIGISLFTVGSLAAAFSPSAWFLIAARAVLGLGAAAMLPATLALVRVTFPDPRERNTAIGIWGAVSVVGAAAGPVLGGLLLEMFWWGSVFLINVPVAIVIIVATMLIGPPNMPRPEKRWDAVSSAFALVAMVGLVMTIKESANPARSGWLIAAAVVCALVGGVAFAVRQRALRAAGREPLLEVSIFRNRMFSGGAVAAVGAMFALSGAELLTTQRFQISADFSPLDAGLLVATAAVAAIPASVIGGSVLHRVGFRTLITGGFLLMVAGVTGSVLSMGNAPLWVFACCLAMTGFGSGSVMSVSSTAIVGSAPFSRAGMASSVEAVSYEFGSLLSVSILGSLMPAVYALRAPAEVAHDVNHGVDHPVFAEAATAAYDSSYLTVLSLSAVIALVAAAVTAWCFAGNPKEVEARETE